jgi:hypothetical protein
MVLNPILRFVGRLNIDSDFILFDAVYFEKAACEERLL